jgi:hypothetical protein
MAASANGDPASDVLLGEKIYFPNEKVSVDTAKALKAVVNKANEKGYAIRVALIKDPTDLGTVPQLIGKPQRYADFLGPEIRFAYKGDLLVVHPAGLGLTTTDETEPAIAAIKGIKVQGGGSSDGLAQTAETAVKSLAKASGHPIDGGKKGGGSGALAAVAVALGLLLLAALAGLWLRRANAPDPAAAPAEEPPRAP